MSAASRRLNTALLADAKRERHDDGGGEGRPRRSVRSAYRKSLH
jgi:hypothetical protein